MVSPRLGASLLANPVPVLLRRQDFFYPILPAVPPFANPRQHAAPSPAALYYSLYTSPAATPTNIYCHNYFDKSIFFNIFAIGICR